MLQAIFGKYNIALKLFLEAWEMEKSLGTRNHSEVWRKIITGVEDMYDKTTWLFPSKKKEFKKDALKFCKRLWDEEKRSAQFGFTERNREIVDAILYLLGNKKDNETAEDELWFYDGMQSATEEEFQEEFDQETDSSVLNKMLRERDEFLDKVIGLCLQLDDREKLTKHKNVKLALYKKVLMRPDLVGDKDYAYDKERLKSKVERLYQELGQEENIPEFRENLLLAWQKQLEEGKDGEKTMEVGVATERIINGILQLCKELNKEEWFRRDGKETLSFYENVWKQAEIKPAEMEKFLHDIKQLATSIEKEKVYDEALQVGFNLLCSTETDIHAGYF